MIQKIAAHCIALPARFKGMHFGRGAAIGPGYDWLSVRLRGVTLGENVKIGRRAWIQIHGNDPKSAIKIGRGTQIGRDVMLTACEGILIGEECLFSFRVSIFDHDHDLYDITKSPVTTGITAGAPVTIGDHCFIGANVCILKGVTLGRHCVVGASSVVTESFPDYSVIAGNPAVLVKTLAQSRQGTLRSQKI